MLLWIKSDFLRFTLFGIVILQGFGSLLGDEGDDQELSKIEPVVVADEDGLPEIIDPRPEAVAKAFPEPKDAVRLNPKNRIWVDKKKERLIVDGYVAVQDGVLELFACPAGTKEHEAVVAVLCKAQEVHAGLIALGLEPGSTVKYDPEYTPARGDKVEVWVLWRDAKGKPQKMAAQQWVKRTGTDKALQYDWVFAGSGFWQDPEDNRNYYLAEAGDLICVSNFGSATLDLPIESSKTNADLMYSAFTAHIPPPGTPVRLVLSKKSDDPQQRKPEGDKD